MYYSPTIRYEAFRLKLYKTGIYIGLVFGGSIGIVAGYLLKTYGG